MKKCILTSHYLERFYSVQFGHLYQAMNLDIRLTSHHLLSAVLLSYCCWPDQLINVFVHVVLPVVIVWFNQLIRIIFGQNWTTKLTWLITSSLQVKQFVKQVSADRTTSIFVNNWMFCVFLSLFTSSQFLPSVPTVKKDKYMFSYFYLKRHWWIYTKKYSFGSRTFLCASMNRKISGKFRIK